MTNPTEEVFLRDVANHEMKVFLDQGVYRHIRFRKPNNSNAWFEIVTWPGHLAYAGDMGSFVFARLEDMFEFFRSSAPDHAPLRINQSYWGEKLDAVDRDGHRSSHKRFVPEMLEARVREILAEWLKDDDLSAEQRTELTDEVEAEVLAYADEGEDWARRKVSEFSHKIDGRRYEFSDSWEWSCEDYTYRFTWCCYAIAWAIRKYDAGAVERAA